MLGDGYSIMASQTIGAGERKVEAAGVRKLCALPTTSPILASGLRVLRHETANLMVPAFR